MEFSTITITEIPHALLIKINRPEQLNSINQQLLKEVNQVIDLLEQRNDIIALVIEGQDTLFCTGMDFNQVSFGSDETKEWVQLYSSTLRRLSNMSKISIAKVKGKVLAGGVGLVAACDLVFANETATFQLSEALWGLIPANVLPYFIRRCGFQTAYFLTLSTQVLPAAEAKNIQLIDCLTEHLDEKIHAMLLRLNYLHPHTIEQLKAYFQKLMPISAQIEALAVETLTHCLNDTRIQSNIKNFIDYKKLPWEK